MIKNQYTTLPDNQTIEKTAAALSKNNFHVSVVENSEQAREAVLRLVPEGADVQLNTSITLQDIGIQNILDTSGKYNSHRAKIFSLDHTKDEKEIRTLRSIADFALGSVHAVTEDGQLIVASNSGSNLPTYAYGAKQVIFVVGAQKLVKDLDEGFKRIHEHSLPLESIRARKAYGQPDTWNSTPSKILVYTKDTSPYARVHVILIKEVIGY